MSKPAKDAMTRPRLPSDGSADSSESDGGVRYFLSSLCLDVGAHGQGPRLHRKLNQTRSARTLIRHFASTQITFNYNQISDYPTGFTANSVNFGMAQSEGFQPQRTPQTANLRKREDLQKRINAYYQGIRDCENHYRCTKRDNTSLSLWITTPTVRSSRRQTLRGDLFAFSGTKSSMTKDKHLTDPSMTQHSGMPWSTRAMSVPGGRRSKSNLRKKSVPQSPSNNLDNTDYYELTGQQKRERMLQQLAETQYCKTFTSKKGDAQKGQFVPVMAYLSEMQQKVE